jgi:hypothetical protein
VRVGVPGNTSHALNHLNILPILSPETRARKEVLRGVGFQDKTPCTKPPKHLTYSILSPETRARKEALREVGFQETHPMH